MTRFHFAPAAALTLAVLAVSATPVLAAWPTNGTPVTTLPSVQLAPALASDGAGGVLVVWEDDRADAGDIYAQRIDAGGVTRWSATGTAICVATGYQGQPRLVSDGAGGAIVSWTDARGAIDAVYAVRVTSSGALAPGWPANGKAVTAAAQHEFTPVMVSDGAGGTLIAWKRLRTVSDLDLYCTRLTASGSFGTGFPTGGRALCDTTGVQDNVVLLADGAGGAFAAWDDTRPGTLGVRDVFATHVGATGTIVSGWPLQGRAVGSGAGSQDMPRIADDGAGGAIVVWPDTRGGDRDLYAQRLNAGGGALWTANGVHVVAPAGDDVNVVVLPGASSSVYLAWEHVPPSGPARPLYVQHLDANGAIFTGWPAEPYTLCDEINSRGLLAGAGDGAGGLTLAWTDARNGPTDLFVQHLTSGLQESYPAGGARFCSAGGDQLPRGAIRDGGTGAIVAWEDLRAGNRDVYALDVAAFGNLSAATIPAGFGSPVVPRRIPGASGNAIVTPVLDGNAATTWVSWAVTQAGPFALPGWSTRVVLDIDTPLDSFTVAGPNAPGTYATFDRGPFTIAGGRHSITSFADPENAIVESNAADDTWTGQWVWSPRTLVPRFPVLRPAPPPAGGLLQPNSDGFRFARSDVSAWVCGLQTLGTGTDDYDLRCYSDYTSSTSGFSLLMRSSIQSGHAADFVIGHRTGTPNTVYPAIVRAVANTKLGAVLDQNVATGRAGLAGSSWWFNQSLPWRRFVDVYEGWFTTGHAYHFVLNRTSGTADLAFAIFPGTSGGVWARAEASRISVARGATQDTATLVAAATGWHPIAIFRPTSANLETDVGYEFGWGADSLAVDAPPTGAPTALAFAEPRPNPVRDQASFRFALPREAVVTLALFDVRGRRVRTLASGAFPAGEHDIRWDGRDDHGTLLAAGLYFARFEAEGVSLVHRVTRLP